MTDREKAERLADTAPALTQTELKQINAIYPAYIFRRRKTREIWTTCCGRHETLSGHGYGDKMVAVMTAEHQAEEKPVQYGCHIGYMSAPRPKERVAVSCPFCGREAAVKELGRTGNRNNLAAYRRVVVFRWYRGALWARAYYTAKKYEAESSLTCGPIWNMSNVYRFKPGEAMCAYSSYWYENWTSTSSLTGRPEKLPLPIHEPFPYNSDEGMSYTLIGADEVDKSPFRYCLLESYIVRSCCAMRFLSICFIYPRQVEMLMKADMADVVSDLVERKKWNAAAFNWDEANPLVSFGLDRLEMQAFLAGSKSLEVLGYYKQFRRLKIRCDIGEIDQLSKCAPYEKMPSVVKRLKAYRIEPARWLAYIQQATQEANENKKRNLLRVPDLAQHWIDYIDAAVVLGYDMKNPLIHTPKQLVKKHDLAAKAAAPVLEARRSAMLSEKEKNRLAEATEKYAFATEKYLIRPPVDCAEIADEGKALKHCIGGYADRHLNGKLTILFLRAAADPLTPLVTIEMNGDRMVQIHGYWNDVRSKISPKEKYAEILEPWLTWLTAGSKRDEDGEPIMPRKKKDRTKVLAAAG